MPLDVATTTPTITLEASSPTLATVGLDGTVTIDWHTVEVEAANPKNPNYMWARLLMCAKLGSPSDPRIGDPCGPDPKLSKDTK